MKKSLLTIALAAAALPLTFAQTSAPSASQTRTPNSDQSTAIKTKKTKKHMKSSNKKVNAKSSTTSPQQ
jgi:hypothetical protein